MRDFKKMQVWEKAHQFVLRLYPITARFPKEETYGLTSQIRRAAASIPANIAEGAGRETQAELAHFLYIASGSAAELDYHLLLARDLGYIDSRDYAELEDCITEIKRMLYGFSQTVKSNTQKTQQP
jgi:four helix bundle protein